MFDIEDYYGEYVRHQSRKRPSGIWREAMRTTISGRPPRSISLENTLRCGMNEVGAALAMNELQGSARTARNPGGRRRSSRTLRTSQEIAGVMLRRQQAEAIIAARQKIVTGAVTMVDMALKALSEHKVVELDDERARPTR